jgi:competence protein ComEA
VALRQIKITKPQLAFTILLLIIIAGLAVAVTGGPRQREPLEINLDAADTFDRQVYASGAVSNPGYYPAAEDTTLNEIIEAAGGLTGDAAITDVTVSVTAGISQSQRVDLNRAESWLLEALPGIGEVRAKAIINYRTTHGPFANPRQLLEVPGISLGIYDGLREYVSVKD